MEVGQGGGSRLGEEWRGEGCVPASRLHLESLDDVVEGRPDDADVALGAGPEEEVGHELAAELALAVVLPELASWGGADGSEEGGYGGASGGGPLGLELG